MKQKSLNILVLLLVAFCFSTCTKPGKNITIIGKVENPITGKGIPGVEIWLLKTTWGINGANKAVKTVFSDENGNFELNKLSVRAESVRIGNLHGDYYTIGWYRDGEYVTEGTTLPIKKGKKMYVDFHAVPYGELQINIKNTACFDQNDKLSIFRTHSIPGFYDDVPNPAVYTGCVNQVGNMNKAPMGWYKFKGTFTKNGVETPIKDSIYLDEGATEIWNINY